MLVGTARHRGMRYLIYSLPNGTLIRFAIWNLIGLAAYLLYGRARSLLRPT